MLQRQRRTMLERTESPVIVAKNGVSRRGVGTFIEITILISLVEFDRSSSGIRYALVHASIFLWRFAVLSPVTFAYISLVTSPAFLRIRAISFLLVLLLGSLLEGVPLFQPVDCKCFVPIRLFPGTTEDVCPLNVGLWFSVSATHWQRTILNGASDFRNGMVFGIKYIQFYKRSCLWIRFMWQ